MCVPLWRTQPESRDARGAMDSRGLVWSQQQKIPVSRLLAGILLQQATGPQLQHLTEKKKHKKTFSNRTTVGCLLEHLSVQCSKRHDYPQSLRGFAPTTTSQQVGKSKPHTPESTWPACKPKGSQAGLYHHPGCFLWTHSSLAPKWPDLRGRFITCADPSLAFWVKLFSLNVK